MENSFLEKKNSRDFELFRRTPPTLTWLDVELTERCNFNCVHCYINLPRNDIQTRRKEMDTQTLKQILSEAESNGCLTVRFTGGDPLVRDDFQELYEFTRKLGIKVVIFTNAALITREWIDLFKRIPPLMEMEISVYGLTKDSMESVTRTRYAYETAMNGIRLLKEAGIPFVVKSTRLPQNSQDMEFFSKWASETCGMKAQPEITEILNLRCRQNSEKNAIIKGLRPKPEMVAQHIINKSTDFKKEMKHYFSSFFISPQPEIFTCSGTHSLSIDAYGHYQLCLLLKHPETLADIHTHTIKSVITEFYPEILKKKSSNPQFLQRCARCMLRCICEQCPARSYMETGTLDTPVQYFCRIAHLQAEYIGIIGKNEKSWEIKDWKNRWQRFIT